MAKLNIPSLQHLARNWKDTPAKVCRELVKVAQHPPIMSYRPLYGAIRDMLVFKTPYEDIVKGIQRHVKREEDRKALLGVLPLIRDHFIQVAPDYVNDVNQRFYPAGRDLMIPFTPPLMYGVNGEKVFPWFSFWRSNPIADQRLALFVSIVKDVLLQDPDLEDAKFLILDFSVPKGQDVRELRIIDAGTVQQISEAERKSMLEVFAEGYQQAQAELAQEKKPSKAEERPQPDPNQPSLFDGK